MAKDKKLEDFKARVKERKAVEAPSRRKMAEAAKKTRAAKRKREDFSQAAARIVREATND